MTEEQKALREAVARASYERWRTTRPNAPAFDVLYSDAKESELSDADAAIAVALERAAEAADNYEGKGMNLDTHTQSGDAFRTRSDIAAAIRALIPHD